jgi:hypothetical protein
VEMMEFQVSTGRSPVSLRAFKRLIEDLRVCFPAATGNNNGSQTEHVEHLLSIARDGRSGFD